MACISCGGGMHWECGDPCCCSQYALTPEEDLSDERENSRNIRRRNGSYKREGTLKDQQSTGRKRAARLYPLDETAACEWRELKFAGGGPFPIVGCSSGLQQARHHGPDKNTLNNDEGNVHRICTKCHNRWHTRNDPVYVAGEISNKHDPDTKATIEEIMNSELYWASKKTVKAKD